MANHNANDPCVEFDLQSEMAYSILKAGLGIDGIVESYDIIETGVELIKRNDELFGPTDYEMSVDETGDIRIRKN